jgi:hypothetical protein
VSTKGRASLGRLDDESRYPDDSVLQSILGRRFGSWRGFVGMVAAYPSMSAAWQYYRDGKSWLFKVSEGKKTVCWVSIRDGLFAVTFYFGSRHDAAVAEVNIDGDLKQRYLDSERSGSIAPLTVQVRRKEQLVDVRRLMDLKRTLR